MKNKTEGIVKAKDVEISISKLKLDQQNPRFNHLQRKPTLSEIEEIILKDSETNILADQILAAGVVIEPILINSNYVVLEGNQRLVALRSLVKQAQEGLIDKNLKEKFQKVRCKIIPDNTDNKTIDLHLARIHVKGKRQWKKFNRASHVYRLNRIHSFSYDRLAEELGMGKATIQRCVIVYKTVLDYSRRYPDDAEWFHKFTYFDYLFQRKDLKDFRDDPRNVSDFIDWVHLGKFHDVRDLYKLSKVVSDRDALEALRKHDFRKALMVLDEKDPSTSSQEFKKIHDALEAIDSINKMNYQELYSNPAKMKLLLRLEMETRSLMVELDSMRKSKVIAR